MIEREYDYWTGARSGRGKLEKWRNVGWSEVRYGSKLLGEATTSERF